MTTPTTNPLIYPPPVTVATSDVTERVQRGARLLDFFESDWRTRINPQQLEFANPCGCIIGQTFPDAPFSAVVLELAIIVGKAEPGTTFVDLTTFPYEYGLDIERDGEVSLAWIAATTPAERDAWQADSEAAYAQLHAAWLVELGAQA